MDCTGRAQTLNLTFTIIAALREKFAGVRISRDARNRIGVLDVNFIIPAKKLRSGSGTFGPSDIFLSSVRFSFFFFFVLGPSIVLFEFFVGIIIFFAYTHERV